MFDAEPDGWEQTTLGAIATLGGGTTPSKSEEGYWSDGSTPWATPSDITSLPSGTARISATEVAVTDRALKECSLPLNPPGTVLMTSRATIGYAALNDVPMATNQGFITFRCGDRADPEFLLHWLTAKRDFLVGAAGGSTFKELSRGTAKLLPILLPPLHEQRRIAEVLRSVDEAITTTQAAVAQGVALWQALAENLIWGLEVQSPECLKPIGTALRGSDYGVNVPLTLEPVGHPVLRMGNIQDGRIDPSDMKWGDVPPSDADALSLNDGDILFNRTNSRDLVGKVALVREPTDCLYASYIVRLSVDRTVADPYYLFAVMHSDRAQSTFKTIATPGVSQSNINPTNLKMQRVPLPDLATQRAIAGQLRSIEDARLGSQQQLEALQMIKKDLATNLLSGRVRVPE